MSKEAHPQTQSRLLSLPRELRDIIYRYALHEPDVITTRGRPNCLALIRTCRFVHIEAELMFYEFNTFGENLSAFGYWIHRIGVARSKKITSLHFRVGFAAPLSGGDSFWQGLEWLAKLPNLRHLELSIDIKDVYRLNQCIRAQPEYTANFPHHAGIYGRFLSTVKRIRGLHHFTIHNIRKKLSGAHELEDHLRPIVMQPNIIDIARAWRLK